eukprot:Protomagalhaensia_sp_Gyna_25__4806@NODE_48_length_6292_cov_422_749400_g36_i0_p1_GENE_NODE_48_length_6292_cov_422_749400_g36_i0NODE_48_length_6292_cov_422_749400_g36_i0_p1_ORF_typecomplete_len623_score123_03ANAPC4_WD40/PF12894_7/1_3e02ANAPC4_WD40/PF12894_7/0_0003ANAPC4_WD40/PF12894_7/1e06ANAPC4_WD40/PF12894_7/0_081WD40/PF00400_32/4_9e02WD40/PF00400_32/1_4WD40/PF00400_32/0_11WD40/PF00400_32/1_3WD40_like/PF17005_5/6_6WD40_like/PF17005_5/2_6e05Ge1_WD40/PF16529_5/14Ge1_WD40/PF16529_5/0_054Ge1_WD40/PF
MNEAEREELQRVIEEKRQSVAVKKEVLNRLKQQLSATETSSRTQQSTKAEDITRIYLEQAVEAAQRARDVAREAFRPPELPVREAAKPVATKPEIDVHIKEPEVLKIEKPVQTDAELERGPPGQPSASPALAPEEEPTRVPTPPTTAEGRVLPPQHLLPRPSEQDDEIQDLTDEERRQIMGSKDFHQFIERTTLTLEKMLNQDKIVNIFEDYTGSATTSVDHSQADRLGEILVFEDSKYAARRTVQHMQVSPKRPHLFLAAYGRRREGGTSETDGTCLIWSLESQTRPQAAFTATSAVTCACFDPNHEALVYGGTAGGSLLLWDMRSGARPVQKTRVALQTHKQAAHTHQTYIRNLFVLGSQHNRTLLSIDEENRCCLWSVSMILTHQSTTDLKWKAPETGLYKATSGETKLSTTAVKARASRIVGATQDGSLWNATYTGTDVLMSNFYPKPYLLDSDGWHRGPVTNLDLQPAVGGRDDDLILTSSTDWSVRLWDLNSAAIPMYSFESSTEFVFDVKWAPNHPAVFATGDGGGSLCIWNLNRSWYQPRIQVQVEPSAAISRLEWLMGGKRVLAGTSTGKVHCAAVGPELSQSRTSLDHFEETLDDLKVKVMQQVNSFSATVV